MNGTEYQTYLASREWALKREAVRERSYGVCERCHFRKMDAVHHLTYARVGKEDLTDLLAICEPCHEFISGKTDVDPKRVLKETRPLVILVGQWLELLVCPFCNQEYGLHQCRTEVFDREEDQDCEGISIKDGEVSKVQSENPSSRRQGVLIHFWCENCDVGKPEGVIDQSSRREWELPLALAIYQHKGSTFIEWRGDVKPDQPQVAR